jgi:hypothetical protein
MSSSLGLPIDHDLNFTKDEHRGTGSSPSSFNGFFAQTVENGDVDPTVEITSPEHDSVVLVESNMTARFDR